MNVGDVVGCRSVGEKYVGKRGIEKALGIEQET